MRLRSLLAVATLAATLAAGSPVLAHEEMTLNGVIAAVGKETIEVRADNGQVFVITFNPGTKVHQAKKPLKIADLKPGTPVSILGYGDQIDYMLALGIEVLPRVGGRG